MPTLNFGLANLAELFKRIKPLPALANGGEMGANPAAPKMETADALPPGPYASMRKEAAFREKFPDTPLEFRGYSDPVQQAKFETVYGNPMANGKTVRQIEHPGFKGRLLQGLKEGWQGLSTGQGQGFLGGVIDPAGSGERVFDAGEGARMRQQQGADMERQGAMAKLAQIFSGIRYQQHQEGIDDARLKLERDRFNQPEWMSPVSVDQNGNPILLQTNRKGGDFRVLGTDAVITNRNAQAEATRKSTEARAEADRKSRENIAKGQQAVSLTNTQANIGSREKIANMNEGGRNYRHNTPSADASDTSSKRKTEADRWFKALQDAYAAGASKESDEVDQAMRELRKYPEYYETGKGQGDFPYAKPRQGAMPKGEVDVEAYVDAVIKAGGTREMAMDKLRASGYLK